MPVWSDEEGAFWPAEMPVESLVAVLVPKEASDFSSGLEADNRDALDRFLPKSRSFNEAANSMGVIREDCKSFK